MNRDCPTIESFEELLSLDPEDPRRLHLERCPRCHARLTAFTAFMDVHPLPAGVRMDEARRRLSDAIRRESETRSGGTRSFPSPSSWFRFGRLVWKPALGVATLLLIGGIFLRGGDHGVDNPPVFRDAGVPQATGAPLVSDRAAGGAIRLRWRSIPASEAYRVLVYGTDLSELSRLEAGRDTTIVLSPDVLARLGGSGTSIFWRVAALRMGDEISVSPPATLFLP
jgi:hypothetical protein